MEVLRDIKDLLVTQRESIKHLDSKAQAAVIRLHNLQADLDGLKKIVAASHTIFLNSMSTDDRGTYAEMIAKDTRMRKFLTDYTG